MTDIKELMNLYAENLDIFNDEEELVTNVKHIIWSGLDETERRILFVYVDLGTMRDTAKIFNVAPSTIFWRIKSIRKKITEGLKNL